MMLDRACKILTTNPFDFEGDKPRTEVSGSSLFLSPHWEHKPSVHVHWGGQEKIDVSGQLLKVYVHFYCAREENCYQRMSLSLPSTYRISPKIRPMPKISPSMIFHIKKGLVCQPRRRGQACIRRVCLELLWFFPYRPKKITTIRVPLHLAH